MPLIYEKNHTYKPAVDLDRCREAVSDRQRGGLRQCSNAGKKPWTNPANGDVYLFCEKHHPDETARRDAASEAKRKSKREQEYRAQLSVYTDAELWSALDQRRAARDKATRAKAKPPRPVEYREEVQTSGSVRRAWLAKRPLGVAELWVTIISDGLTPCVVLGGVELHRYFPANANEKDCPPEGYGSVYDTCGIVNGPCRHSGSSLDFEAVLAPLIEASGGVITPEIEAKLVANVNDWADTRLNLDLDLDLDLGKL